MSAVELRNGTKFYGSYRALDDVTMRVGTGEFVAVVGPSGSGKTTLLHALGTLDRLDSGTLTVAGRRVAELDDDALARLRAEHIGFVFQSFHLAAGLTAVENVAEGLVYAGARPGARRERARAALERVGLAPRMHHRSHELSGGEKQRVAIARAIVGVPAVVLADEPTGALDTMTGEHIFQLLRDLNSLGTTIVVITHDRALAARFDRRIMIRDGRTQLEDSPHAPDGNGQRS
ncbi:ABC transporter ATP-binding protein [Isoptericola halotolerans]|uniref:ABC transporter ATP-binding protein n=1 Tax=Isoptericola halotolerans TaxID=300560 RepID=UPI00388D09A8